MRFRQCQRNQAAAEPGGRVAGTEPERTAAMARMRQLIIATLVVVVAAPAASEQSTPEDPWPPTAASPALRLNLQAFPPLQPPQQRSAALHPAAKGAIVGGAIGAGSFGALGLWYCTIGPSEVGECGIEQWVPGLLVWGAVGAGIGALIGAIRASR